MKCVAAKGIHRKLASEFLTQKDYIITPQTKMHETRMMRLPQSGGVGYSCRTITMGLNLIPTRRYFYCKNHSSPFIFPHRHVGSKRKSVGPVLNQDFRRIVNLSGDLNYCFNTQTQNFLGKPLDSNNDFEMSWEQNKKSMKRSKLYEESTSDSYEPELKRKRLVSDNC